MTSSREMDDTFSVQVGEWRKAQDVLLQGDPKNLDICWIHNSNTSSRTWLFKKNKKHGKQPENPSLAVASKKEVADSKQWDSYTGCNHKVNGYWRGKGKKNSKRQTETDLISLNKSSEKASLRQGRANSQMTQKTQTNSRKPSTAREQKT